MIDDVDGEQSAVDGRAGVWVSMTELARLKGVSKQAISKRVDRLVGEGLLETKREGRTLTVNLAEYDTATDETTDPAKLLGRDTARQVRAEQAATVESPIKDPTYTQALTRKALFEAELKEIELKTRMGLLLSVDDVRRSMELCAEAIVRELQQLPSLAEDLTAAVSRGGVGALRRELKVKVRSLREMLARSMTLLAASSDEEDEG